jgi:tRNA-Thr(GGU) m(6)t(6)A37 methyltransferase TsaA
MPRALELHPVGVVASSLTERSLAPCQADEGAPPASLLFAPQFLACLAGIRRGDSIVVLTWLDRADRETLAVHPRGDTSRPRLGVFATRSADRPNPIGLHRVEVTEVEGTRLGVAALEALDGTPILDVKPVLTANIDQR